MNPLTNVKNLQKLNERELELGNIGKRSWHDEYKDSAWVFIGGLPYDLTEGDVICVFSQYGEVVNLNLIRDHKTGKTKGYGFLCYEDQRSTVLAVDNLNGIKILSRTIRVDHVKDYKIPKEHGDEDELTLKIRDEGCAPRLPSSSEEEEKADLGSEKKATKQNKKDKKKMKNKKKRRKSASSTSSSDSSDSEEEEEENRGRAKVEMKIKSEKGSEKIKLEKPERGYGDPYSSSQASGSRQREDKQRTKSSNSRTDVRDRLERNGRDRLDGSDDDDGSRRDRGRNEKKRDLGYRGDRYAANGSHSRDEFGDDRFGAGSSRRDRSSEMYGNTSRAWDNDTDSGRMRQRSWERQGRRRQEDWRFDRRGDR